jgi:iron complex outermembrane recepter protein
MDTFLFVLAALLSGDATQSATTPAFEETMVVSAIRADNETPVTKSDIGHEEIEERYHGQDIPLLLRDAPSINAWSESGSGGAGYSYITLRGVSPTRINFTLDGVPLADSEDMGTYFVDFPDLARSLQSIQIQRGVGTSTVGSPSFGGSVNLESIALSQEESFSATLGGGSFGNQQASVAYQSGALPGGLSLYTRASHLQSEGFRESSDIRQRNLFVSAAKNLGDTAQLKLTGFTGREWQQLSFYATDADTLRTNMRANPLRPEEKDSFGYDLAQLQYLRAGMTASVYYQRGYGLYRLFDLDGETLREYGLDGVLAGSILSFERTDGALRTNYGVHVNRFKRDHTRDDLAARSRDYANYGVKGEANAFAKFTWTRNAWTLYGDAQVRRASFDYHGDQDIEPIAWTFFNPKIGVRRALTARSSVYSSIGMSTREPGRTDMFLGEDNPSVVHDLHAVKPERVYDFELGWNFRTNRIDLAANVYAMEFRNEIAATGELSEVGLLLRRNVDRSYRRGIELELAWQARDDMRLMTSANVSRNRIGEWTQFYDVYDADFNWIDSRAVTYRDVEPLLTPDVIINQAVEYSPIARLSLGATARYVGGAYLDNTNNEDFATPSFFVADAKASYAVTPRARVTLQVNNLFDRERIYPSGYSYLYFADGVQTGTAHYYAQASRNAVLLLDLEL